MAADAVDLSESELAPTGSAPRTFAAGRVRTEAVALASACLFLAAMALVGLMPERQSVTSRTLDTDHWTLRGTLSSLLPLGTSVAS